MHHHSIDAIPADGIGKEVVTAGLEVLDVLANHSGDFVLNVQEFSCGSDYFRRHGMMMPVDALSTLNGFDAILFGPVGTPDVSDHVTLWGLRLPICQGFDQYANVRPT